LIGWRAARRIVRHAVTVEQGPLLDQLRALSVEMRVRSAPALRVGQGQFSPWCTGVLSPVIVVPEDAASWSEERARLVLLQELAHVKRHDCLLQIVVQFAAALHWYNPLSWWAVRVARLEREAAADDLVAATGVRASDHAAELLGMARALLVPGPRFAAR